MREKIKNIIYSFFINSNDFNGIPLRNISKELEIEYEESIDFVKELVLENIVSIQSSTNPHIIYSKHYSIDNQIRILEEAKKITESTQSFGKINLVFENTDFPICVYPSVSYLKLNRDLTSFKNAYYTKQLAVGEPQVKPIFFEIEVLDRYFNDPRFDFRFDDYSGEIYSKYDEGGRPINKEADNIFLKTFGLGIDEKGNRLAVVYLIYLNDLTEEHQAYWKSKEHEGKGKILEEYYLNTILGEWTSSFSVFSGFLGELKCINTISEMKYYKPIFKHSFESDSRPKEFTFFFMPTLKNYNDFILLLDKMISENINYDFFNDKIEKFHLIENENGIVEKQYKGKLQLLEEWLSSISYFKENEFVSDWIKVLKKVRKERQTPAHKINSNQYDKKFIELQKEKMNEVYSVFKKMRNFIAQKLNIVDFEIPDWLDNGNVKSF